MHLFVCVTSFVLTILLSSLKANNTSGISDVNTSSFMPDTNIPKASTEKNVAPIPQHQPSTMSPDRVTTKLMDFVLNESSTISLTTPESHSPVEINTENSATKSLTRDATSSVSTTTKSLTTISIQSQPATTVSIKSPSTIAAFVKPQFTSAAPEILQPTTLGAGESLPTTLGALESRPTTLGAGEFRPATYGAVESRPTTLGALESRATTVGVVIAQPTATDTDSSAEKSTTAEALLKYIKTTPTNTEDSLLQDIFPVSSHYVNATPEEEHNNILIPTERNAVTDKGVEIVVGHKCYKIFQDSILWNDTDGGMLALKSCPVGYQGNMYRPCFSSGKWGNVDYSECRLEHLGRMRRMIVHLVEKGMLSNMFVLAEKFSKYISSVDMKSPMDRLEAFEIVNTFLKVDMNLKMDKSRDKKYIQTLLHLCNEFIKKKTVLFSPGSQENKLISEKAVEMVFDLTYFAERCLRGLLKTQKMQIAFRSSPNVVLYLYRGKLSGQLTLTNFTSEYEREEEMSSILSLENTLERSAYALIWIKGLRRLLSTKKLVVNSDVAVATILSPLNSLTHMAHPPTFDIGLRMEKAEVEGYTLKCGQLWNMSKLWNTKDCTKANVKGDIVTCRCHHLGSIALLLEEDSEIKTLPGISPIGKLISCSCVISLSATILTLITYYFLLHREEQHLSIFIFVNMITCLLAVQLMILYGVNKGGQHEVCMSFAIMLHYLFMVLCCWVVAYGVNLLKRLRSNMEYNGRPRDFCAACWISPGIMLTIAFILNPDGYETRLYCWMNIERGILWSFVFPVTALILINTVVMILALKTFNEQMSVTHRSEICKTRNSLRAGLTLLPFFAVNWFFGILAVEDSFNLMLQLIFCLTNAMQGILTFIFFCLMDANIVAFFRLKITVVTRKPKVSSMKLTKSGSFPILERSLIALADDRRRLDCTPLLSSRMAYHDAAEDPCCSNIRV